MENKNIGNSMKKIARKDLIDKLQLICDSFSDILGMVILFGSYSRDDATDASDIDLYIEPRDSSMTSSKLWANKRYKDFKYMLYDSFSCEFDLLSYGGKRDLNTIRNSPLWRQIEKDGIVIYDKESKGL